MQGSRCALVALLLAVAPLARADLVEWHVAGAIARVGEELAPGQPLGPDSAAIAEALAGIGIRVGAAWSADLTFDSSAAPFVAAWSPTAESFPANTGLSVSAGAFSASSLTGGLFSPYGSGGGSATARSDPGSFSLTFDAGLFSSLFGELFPFEGTSGFQAKLVMVGAPADLLPGDSLPTDPPALELLGSGSGFFMTSELETPSLARGLRGRGLDHRAPTRARARNLVPCGARSDPCAAPPATANLALPSLESAPTRVG